MRLLLDSHVVLWWLSESHLLSSRVRGAIRSADAILVSPISVWEITLLAARGRVLLDEAPHRWAQSLLEQDGVDEAPLTAAAAVGAALLDPARFPGDPADRLLYATARDLDVTFATRDRAMRAYAREQRDVRVLW